MEGAKEIAVNDPREKPDRYLPLDRKTAAMFLRDWTPMVSGLLARMRVPDGDETASRVFQRALNALPSFRGESRLSTWLYQIAWREGLRQISKTKKHADHLAPLDSIANLADKGRDQLQILERQETAEQVREMLDRLPVRDKEVLALRFLEELPFAQVAERMNIKESAAKVRCHRALARLRNFLEDLPGGLS